METSNAGMVGARQSTQQPLAPFYSRPDSRTPSLSSSPSTTTEYSPTRNFTGTHGYPAFGPSVANASDSMMVERGSPSPTPAVPTTEGRREDHEDHRFGDRNVVLAAMSNPTGILPSAMVDADITHTRTNDEENSDDIPNFVNYPSDRAANPPDLSNNNPLSAPPYPSQLDDNDLEGLPSIDAVAPEPSIAHRQQESGISTFASKSRPGDALVDNGFVVISHTDAEERWVKVRRQERDV